MGLYLSWFLAGVLLLSSYKGCTKGTSRRRESSILPTFINVLGVSVASVTGGPSDDAGEQADTLVEELSTLTVILS